jgi:DNA mismatch endonuclease (patch repair protein)
VAIFVNGCYWHRCPYCALPLPKTNVEFWQQKFERNMARDARTHRTLLEQRWCVLDVWECQLKGARLERTMEALVSEVGRASARETGRLRLPGATAPWKLARRRRRLHR